MHGNPFGLHGFQLFAAAPEYERVAAFKAHNAQALARRRHEPHMNLRLRNSMVALRFADRHARRVSPDQAEDFRAHQPVIVDNVGFLQHAQRLQRQQFRIARPCADNVHHTRSAPGCQCLRFQQRFGLVQVARIGSLRRRPCQRPLPVTAPRALVRNRFSYKHPQAARQRRQFADTCRQQGLKLRAYSLRQHWRRPARADRGNNLAPVEDRRHGKITILRLVHDVHRNAPRPNGGERFATMHLVRFSDDSEPRARERRDPRAPRGHGHTGSELRRQRRIAKPADQHQLRRRGDQQAQFARRLFAVSEHNDARAVEVKECRKLAHRGATLLFSGAGGTHPQNLLDAQAATGNP